MTVATSTSTQTGIVLAHSISSRVELDFDHGTASKTYSPPRWVSLLYRAAFQAPFPYSSNRDAIEASKHRRKIAGHLTLYWFGWDVVSPVLDIRGEPGEPIGFVTQLVPGSAPSDRRRARTFLREVTARFLEAGLPTWQVTPHNPRAIGNLMELDEGMYRIIDLESNLVAPLMPVSGIVGAVRQGTFPAFDDIDLDRLDAYLAHHGPAIREAIGDVRYLDLVKSAARYRHAADAWHKAEPRIISRALRLALKLVDVPSWIRGIRRATANSTSMADRFVQRGIQTWQDEGHIDEREAARLRDASNTPEVASALTHLGAHVAMTIPLRFPLGSVARAGWTLSMRAKAELGALLHRRPATSARQEHTLLVAAVSLLPGLGAAAYTLAKPLRSNRELAFIAFDQMLRKIPMRLYQRLHLSSLMVWHARKTDAPRASVCASFRDRVRLLRPAMRPISAVLAVNFTIVIIGGVLYVTNGSEAMFAEKNVMATSDALQLALAGVAGIAAYRLFWRTSGAVERLDEAAGSFFWGIAGIGMLFLAADDYFGVHERVGEGIATYTRVIPLFTNTADDIVTIFVGITGVAVLYVFRDELFARRASSVLLLAGVSAAALMTVVDVYGRGWLRPVEFPAQVAASGLLMLAFVHRYAEVRGRVQAAPARQTADIRADLSEIAGAA